MVNRMSEEEEAIEKETKEILKEYNIPSLLEEYNQVIAERYRAGRYSIQFCNETNQCVDTGRSFGEHNALAFKLGKKISELTVEDIKEWDESPHKLKQISATTFAENEMLDPEVREVAIADVIRVTKANIKHYENSLKKFDKFRKREEE